MFLVTFVLVFVVRARSFILIELYIPLIAAGSVFIEEKLAGPGWRRGTRIAVVSCLLAGGILVAPSALPLLPVELLPAYAKSFGFLYMPGKDFQSGKSDYPQEFSNRIGWEELVGEAARFAVAFLER